MSYRMTHRKEKILEAIVSRAGYTTGEHLAQAFGVSARTIRQDIKQLSLNLLAQGIHLQAVPSKGYCIPAQELDKAKTYLASLRSLPADIPISPDARFQNILRMLLFGTGNLDLDDQADKMYVSRSTIEKDMREVRRWLADHNLRLRGKKVRSVYLQGSESALRYAMVNYFWHFHDFSTLSDLNILKETVEESAVREAEKLIHRLRAAAGVNLNDADYLNLVIYLCVSIARVKANHTFQQVDIPDHIEIASRREHSLAKVIAQGVEREFGVQLSPEEIAHLAYYLMQVNFAPETAEMEGGEREGGLSNLTAEVIEKLKTRFGKDFSSDRVLAGSLRAHLDSLSKRRDLKALVKTPGLNEIIREYPEALDMAVLVSELVKQRFAVSLDENEIGSIALYLCAAIERQKDLAHIAGAKVAIICATGSGGSQLLAIKIRRSFPDVQINGVYPAYCLQDAIREKPDLIISTIPVTDCAIPVVHISHLLNDADDAGIRQALDDITAPKNALELSELFRPEYFFAPIDLNKSTEVIAFMCAELEKQGCVEGGFAHSVLERESIFPTGIGNLTAIPHALLPDTSSSWIAVGILRKPVQWGSDMAQLILLLNIDNSAEDNFKRIYNRLYERINDKKTVERMIKASNYDEFIKVINE